MAIQIRNPSIVVFDLDDTLYAEIDFLKSAFREISKLLEPVRSIVLYERMLAIYESGKSPFQELITAYRFTVEQLLALYRAHYPEIKLKEGAEKLLSSLDKSDCKLGLITDGRSIGQRNKIDALGLTPYFTDVIISEEFGSTKPSPENYQYYMNKYPGCDYYYIGDNFSKDFIAPNQLGWTTIGIRHHDKNIHLPAVELPKEYLPHHLIDSFDEISVACDNFAD